MIQVHILLLGGVPGGNWGEKTLPASPVIGMMFSTPSSLHGPTAAVNESGEVTWGGDLCINWLKGIQIYPQK